MTILIQTAYNCIFHTTKCLIMTNHLILHTKQFCEIYHSPTFNDEDYQELYQLVDNISSDLQAFVASGLKQNLITKLEQHKWHLSQNNEHTDYILSVFECINTSGKDTPTLVKKLNLLV